MQCGISTASLFVRQTTEDALKFLSDNNVKTAEVFLSTYCEYTKEFGEILRKRKGNTLINSVHVLNTQYEPQLYSVNPRARDDAFKILDGAMTVAKMLGAKYYTFHGVARMKKTPLVMNYERIGTLTQAIIDKCKEYSVTLTYENVHWAYYNFAGFFKEVKSCTNGLKATLDIKQARQSGVPYADYILDMAEDIVTVHLSDIDENGKMCVPGKGVTDFYDIFTRLKDVGFDGALLLEVYQNDYKEYKELFDSLDFIKNLAVKVFGKPL